MQTAPCYVADSVSPSLADVQLGYNELVEQVRAHLGWGGRKPSTSTISRWMKEVLDYGEHDPKNPRLYSMEDVRSLVFWGRAGEFTQRGSKANRIYRRKRIFLEAQEQWELNQQKS